MHCFQSFLVSQSVSEGVDFRFVAWVLWSILTKLVFIGVIAWIESTMCSKGVIDIGGHLIYDAYIPLASMAFYMIYWAAVQPSKQKTL